MKLKLPPHFSINQKIGKNFVYQLAIESQEIDVAINSFSFKRIKGFIATDGNGNELLLSPKKIWSAQTGYDRVLLIEDAANLSEENLDTKELIWIKHPELTQSYSADLVQGSYLNSFSFVKEDAANNIEGLRSPQIGGIHAALAHWQIGIETATIVMPTGTGKTETMLSLLVAADCQKLLVVVPTDALRSQIASKFFSLGLLKKFGIIKKESLFPRVGILKHRLVTIDEVKTFFSECNVIITTMSIVGQLNLEIQSEIAEQCSHLFIDEAHHIAANTWNQFRTSFTHKPILQFTATPYRNDDKSIGGKIIFNYPLKKAQDEGYFKKINYNPIYEYNSELYDESIAAKAIEQLKSDIENGYNHILMARVNSTDRANFVFDIYKKYAEFNPVQIHSALSNDERIEARNTILNKETRIIVCVDMLGEGFDLPELKIAAFHDIKKSLPITLQLAGRFTRSSRDSFLGEASIIVNLANVEVSEELEHLYAQDSDWNSLLPIISEKNTQEQEDFYDFIKGFEKFPNEIQLQNVRPSLSTVVYKTNTDTWYPNNFGKGIQGLENYEQVYSDINSEKRTLVVVTGAKNSVKWGKLKDIFQLDWTLYVIYWNQNQQLLYINCSANGSMFESLAKAITFGTAQPINAENVYRSLGRITRLKINNVGLKEQLGKQKSFTMHTGEDVEPALSPVQLLNKIKSNIFGVGFEDGAKVSIGCSYKGRVWSRQNGNIEEFVKWCDFTGNKLLDETIDPNSVLQGAIYLKTIKARPSFLPISIEWNEDIHKRNEQSIYVIYRDVPYPFDTFDINLIAPSETGNIKFSISNEVFESCFELEIRENGFSILNTVNPSFIQLNSSKYSFEEYFYNSSPIIRFVNGAWLEGNQFADFVFSGSPYSRENILTWDWSDINIRNESQGEQKLKDNIQFKVISELAKRDFDVIFDDDSSGEAADVITVRVDDISKVIQVELFHLKYSHGDDAGARISDLYEVCGQAQKSVFWKGKGGFELFKHMIERENRRTNQGQNSRLEKGDIKQLSQIKDKSKRFYSTNFRIYIVQPGLSKARASEQQLELLAVTENHLLETYKIELEVIASS